MKAQLNLLIIFLLIGVYVYASQDWLSEMIEVKQDRNKTLTETPTFNKGFYSDHALVFFYSSTCPHCHQFSPVLKNWSLSHQASVIALSFDNKPLPEFSEFDPVTTEWVNVAFAGSSISYPALFIVNKNTHVLYPVTFGGLDEMELEDRINNLVSKIQSYEHKGVLA